MIPEFNFHLRAEAFEYAHAQRARRIDEAQRRGRGKSEAEPLVRYGSRPLMPEQEHVVAWCHREVRAMHKDPTFPLEHIHQCTHQLLCVNVLDVAVQSAAHPGEVADPNAPWVAF